jgi:outer membrane lipoprotein-sorting protein
MNRCRHPGLLVVLFLMVSLTGCLWRSRKVETRTVSTADLMAATRDELVARINEEARKIQTLNATVDIATSVGGEKRGKVTDYQEIRGYVLVRKPAMLRMIGLFPVVRNKAFDMVSDGRDFRLSIPTKNRFVMGRNDVIHPSKQPLENLRPQHIFDALLLKPIETSTEIAVLEAGMEIVRDAKGKELWQPNYVMTVIRREERGWFLSRKIYFSRTDLNPARQVVYDEHGNVATDALYVKFAEFDGVMFPSRIHIARPQEEYAITLSMVKLRVNETLRDDQFELEQPEGAQVVRLDQPKAENKAQPPGGGATPQ